MPSTSSCTQEFPQQAVRSGEGRRPPRLHEADGRVGGDGRPRGLPPAGRDASCRTSISPRASSPASRSSSPRAMTLGGVATGVLVESHMNRPTKIEGNPEHPSSLGASDAFMQASVLGLYDPDRSQVVRKLGDTATWGDFIAALQPVLNAAKTNGAGLRILTQTITSPTLGAQMQALLAQYPGMKWHQWEAVNRDNVREGGRMAFGQLRQHALRLHESERRRLPRLRFPRRRSGPSPLRARFHVPPQGAQTAAATQSINRLYAIEGGMSEHRLGRRSPHRREAVADRRHRARRSSPGEREPSVVADADQGSAGQPRRERRHRRRGTAGRRSRASRTRSTRSSATSARRCSSPIRSKSRR